MAVAEEKDRLVPAEAEAKWRARQAEKALAESVASAEAAQKVQSIMRMYPIILHEIVTVLRTLNRLHSNDCDGSLTTE